MAHAVSSKQCSLARSRPKTRAHQACELRQVLQRGGQHIPHFAGQHAAHVLQASQHRQGGRHAADLAQVQARQAAMQT